MQNSAALLDGVTATGSFAYETTRLLFYAVSHDEMLLTLPSKWKEPNSTFGSLVPKRSVVTLEDLHSAKLPNYMLMAIPGFVILCILEILVGLARGKTLYRVNDAGLWLFSFIYGRRDNLSSHSQQSALVHF